MKLQFTMDICLKVNGRLYDVIVESYKTVTKVHYKRAGWAMWHNVITLKGKDRNMPIGIAIAKDLKK